MKLKFLLIISLLSSLSLHAQKEDLELWSSIKFSKKVNSKVRFVLEEQIRWADSISVYKKNFTDLGLRYKINKIHAISGHFRLNSDADNAKKYRSHLDFCSDFKISNWKLIFNHRLRFQQSWDELGELDKRCVRSKIGFEWQTNFMSPYISHEFYWNKNTNYQMSQQRSTLGLSWNMSDKFKSKLFMRTENEMNTDKPDKLSIIGVGAHYKF